MKWKNEASNKEHEYPRIPLSRWKLCIWVVGVNAGM